GQAQRDGQRGLEVALDGAQPRLRRPAVEVAAVVGEGDPDPHPGRLPPGGPRPVQSVSSWRYGGSAPGRETVTAAARAAWASTAATSSAGGGGSAARGAPPTPP